MCTRFIYEGDTKGPYIVGRSMDWAEDPNSDLWFFPKGLQRDGGLGGGSIEWTAKYGSIITSVYDGATVDGLNEAGLVANALYLSESDYGNANASRKPLLSVGGWTQYILDSYASVAEAVDALSQEQFAIVSSLLPNGKPAGGHLALADATGDSAILEYLDGKLVIHHGRNYTVMTNSPPFDQQLALDTYWNEVGGTRFLPGTYRPADRFVRISWNLRVAPKVWDSKLAIATVFSMIRGISVPLGLADPEKPNIAATIWRSVSDILAQRYYFESAYTPSIFWVDLQKLLQTSGPSKLELSAKPNLAGEVSANFEPADPFHFLTPHA